MARIIVTTNQGRTLATFVDRGGESDAPIPDGLPGDIAEAVQEARVEDTEEEFRALAMLAAIVEERGDLSEGQLVAITGLDRLRLREVQDIGSRLLDGRTSLPGSTTVNRVNPVWRRRRGRGGDIMAGEAMMPIESGVQSLMSGEPRE